MDSFRWYKKAFRGIKMRIQITNLEQFTIWSKGMRGCQKCLMIWNNIRFGQDMLGYCHITPRWLRNRELKEHFKLRGKHE